MDVTVARLHPHRTAAALPCRGAPRMDPHGPSIQHPYAAGGSELAPPDSAAAGPKPGGDVKPRLTKDQHDILEQHFQQQHKPTTGVKKAFADRLGVPLDKINVSLQT